MTRTQLRDLVLGLLILVTALVGLFIIIPKGIMSPGQVDIRALSPSFWPSIVMGGLALAGATILIQGLLAKRDPDRPLLSCPKSDNEPDDDSLPPGIAALKVGTAILGLFVYFWLIQTIGYIVASSLAVIAYTLLGGERRIGLIAMIAVVLPVLLYYFFTYVASIPIPLGYFETWQ